MRQIVLTMKAILDFRAEDHFSGFFISLFTCHFQSTLCLEHLCRIFRSLDHYLSAVS